MWMVPNEITWFLGVLYKYLERDNDKAFGPYNGHNTPPEMILAHV